MSEVCVGVVVVGVLRVKKKKRIDCRGGFRGLSLSYLCRYRAIVLFILSYLMIIFIVISTPSHLFLYFPQKDHR